MGKKAKLCIGVIVIIVILILFILNYMSTQHPEISDPNPQSNGTPYTQDESHIYVTIENEFDREVIVSFTVKYSDTAIETYRNISIDANSISKDFMLFDASPGRIYTYDIKVIINDTSVYETLKSDSSNVYIKIYEGEGFQTTAESDSGSIELKAGRSHGIVLGYLYYGDTIEYSWDTDDMADKVVFYIENSTGEQYDYRAASTPHSGSHIFDVPSNNTYLLQWENQNWIDTASIKYSYTITHSLDEKEIIISCN